MQTRSAPTWLTARLLWAALLSSIAIYAAVLGLNSVETQPPGAEPPDPALIPAMGLAALAAAAMSVWLPRYLFAQHLKSAAIATEEVPDPDGSVMFRDRSPTVRVAADPDAADRTLQQVFMTPHVISLALSEAVAVFGFALGMLGVPFEVSLVFFVAAAGLIAARFPRPAAVRARAETILGIRFERP